MQRDPIPLTVQDYGAKAVLTDGMNGLDDLAAVFRGFDDGILDPTVDVHIQEDSRSSTDFGFVGDEAAAVARVVIEHGKFEVVELRLVHGNAEGCGVERGRPIEIRHRDVEPYHAVVEGIHVAHE